MSIIRPLKARSTPSVKWILYTINIESHDNDDAWTGEVISRGLRKKIKMSSVSIVANKVTLKGTVNRVFLETMFFLSIIQTEHPSLLDYAESVTMVDIGKINVDQQGTFKVILCRWESP